MSPTSEYLHLTTVLKSEPTAIINKEQGWDFAIFPVWKRAAQKEVKKQFVLIMFCEDRYYQLCSLSQPCSLSHDV